jgi:hypothetical protein
MTIATDRDKDFTGRALIIGAGALGTAVGLRLQQAGTALTFLAKREHAERLSRPQFIHHEPDSRDSELSDFDVIYDLNEASPNDIDWVILSLNGAILKSSVGRDLLARLGTHFRGTKATLLLCSVGLGLIEFVQKASRWNPERCIQGTLAHYVYQNHMSDGHTTDKRTVDYCSFKLPGAPSFILSDQPAKASAEFQALYDDSPLSPCARLTNELFQLNTTLFLPHMLVCDIAGWPASDELVKMPDLWSLYCEASREIMGLPIFGASGESMLQNSSNDELAEQLLARTEALKPFDIDAFNRFHHGGKMKAQNELMFADCIEHALENGINVPACQQLINKSNANPE